MLLVVAIFSAVCADKSNNNNNTTSSSDSVKASSNSDYNGRVLIASATPNMVMITLLEQGNQSIQSINLKSCTLEDDENHVYKFDSYNLTLYKHPQQPSEYSSQGVAIVPYNGQEPAPQNETLYWNLGSQSTLTSGKNVYFYDPSHNLISTYLITAQN